MVKEFYKILEISETATQEEIKKAYRRLALKWHPDKNPNNQEEAKKKFQEINKAYGVLSNEGLRKRYDNGETDFATDYGNEQEKAFWEAKEEKLAEEIRIMEEMLKLGKEETEIMEKIWLLNAEYLERSDTSSNISNTFSFTYPRVFEEDLDSKINKLWEPYQDWREMVWTIPLNLKRKEKEHSEELKILKEEMIKAIKEAEVKKQTEEKDKQSKKKERAGSKVERERTSAIEEIERLMSEKKLKAQDLGEYSNYKEKINELDKIWKIRDLRDRIIEEINHQKAKGGGSNDRTKGKEQKGEKTNRPTNQNKQDEKGEEGQIPSKSDDNNQKINYGNLTRAELINTINQKDLENSSLKEIIAALERKIEELEEEIAELKAENPQTSEIRQGIEKREKQLKEVRNSLEKINVTENNNEDKGNNNKSNNNFPTGLVIGGVVFVVLSLLAISLIVNKKKT